MKLSRYSRQREIIYDAVVSNRAHPTAEFIYNYLKKDNPQLSLGTVYRNLGQLSESREILRLTVADGPDRFDGELGQHYHMICEACGEVFDVCVGYVSELDEMIAAKTGLKIRSHDIVFRTMCKKCTPVSV